MYFISLYRIEGISRLRFLRRQSFHAIELNSNARADLNNTHAGVTWKN